MRESVCREEAALPRHLLECAARYLVAKRGDARLRKVQGLQVAAVAEDLAANGAEAGRETDRPERDAVLVGSSGDPGRARGHINVAVAVWDDRALRCRHPVATTVPSVPRISVSHRPSNTASEVATVVRAASCPSNAVGIVVAVPRAFAQPCIRSPSRRAACPRRTIAYTATLGRLRRRRRGIRRRRRG